MSARSDLIAACLQSEADDYLTGARNWRADAKPSITQGDTWDRAGLQALVDSAAAEAGVALPYNFAAGGPWQMHRKAGWHTDHREQMVSAAARMAGWLRTVPQYPVLQRLLSHTLSTRGMGSPRTSLDMWSLVLGEPSRVDPLTGQCRGSRGIRSMSPGAAAKFIGAVIRRADAILSPAGARVSWQGVALALGQSRRVGRAAMIAAAITLSSDHYPLSYRAARARMIELCRTVRSRADSTDGVVGHVGRAVVVHVPAQDSILVGSSSRETTAPETVVKVRPIVVALMRHSRNGEHRHPVARQLQRLVTDRRGRSYHADCNWSVDGLTMEQMAARQAVRAWAQQDAASASERNMLRTDLSILVRREDSYAAGNCKIGTEAYMQARGWSNRWYVPAQWALASGEPRARNAVAVAARALS